MPLLLFEYGIVATLRATSLDYHKYFI